MANFSFLAIAVATVVAFMLGGLWYSPLLFTKPWMKGAGLTEDECGKRSTGMLFFTTFLLCLASTVLLAYILGPKPGLVHGAMAGLMIGIGWVATAIGTNQLFEGKSGTYFAITAGYHIVRFFLTGLILGLLQ